jgi:dCMP deaminase
MQNIIIGGIMINHYTVNTENPKSWDEYFYNICKVVASNSKCLSRKIGAAIVYDKTIISTGYNGPPRGVQTCDNRWLNDSSIRNYIIKKTDDKKWLYVSPKGKFFQNKLKGKCPRYISDMGFQSGQGLEWCVAGHAERNAIVNAARLGLHKLKGTKIYMTCGVPCTPCLIEIINAGIEEIIVTAYRNAFYDQSSKYLLDQSQIAIRTYDFIEDEKSTDKDI